MKINVQITGGVKFIFEIRMCLGKVKHDSNVVFCSVVYLSVRSGLLLNIRFNESAAVRIPGIT